MKFWVAHSDEVSVREQIVTQVSLGIASGELKAGARLPSTREMARRFGVHANTVSAAYREMEREGRLESRRGSGVYVACQSAGSGTALDQLTATYLAETSRLGFAVGDVRASLRRWLEVEPWEHFLLVEPDPELRRIVVQELRDTLSSPVRGVGLEEFASESASGSLVLVLPSKEAAVRAQMVVGRELTVLQVRPVQAELTPWLPAPETVLVGICSRWPEFVRLARAMLVGAGLDASAIVARDARMKGWQRGLEGTIAVVCDVVAAGDLPPSVKALVFKIVAEGSVLALRKKEQALGRDDQGAL